MFWFNWPCFSSSFKYFLRGTWSNGLSQIWWNGTFGKVWTIQAVVGDHRPELARESTRGLGQTVRTENSPDNVSTLWTQRPHNEWCEQVRNPEGFSRAEQEATPSWHAEVRCSHFFLIVLGLVKHWFNGCAQIGHNDGLGHILSETTVTLFIRAHSAWLGPPHKLPRGGCVPGHLLADDGQLYRNPPVKQQGNTFFNPTAFFFSSQR